MPVIAEVAPGVFVDAGTSGHGFKLGPALGADVAALVIGHEVDAAIRSSPRRASARATPWQQGTGAQRS